MSIDQFSTDLTEQLWWAQSQQQTMMEQNPNAHPSPKPHKFLTPHPNSSWPPSHLYHHHRQQQSSWLSSYNPQEPPPSIFSTQIPSLDFDLNHEEIDEDQLATVHEDEAARQQWQSLQQQMEKEPMFEKPLTPSDVGKLNRLVIPKQHAENYFPLSGGDSGDKGLLLSFEDESGKCWRFRYSYWNSSQSYVLTKGWSRYVKEKQLDAGDVVFFERHRIDGDRLFIGWRRRVDSSSGLAVQGSHSGVWGRGLYSSGAAGHQPYPSAGSVATTTCVPYHPDCVHAGPVAQNQTAITVGNSRRRLRLFGVNLECQLDESEPSTPDGSSVSSSQGLALQQLYSQSVFSSDSPDKQMNMLFCQDKRNYRG